LAETEHKQVVLRFPAPRTKVEASANGGTVQKTIGIASLGIGGAALAAGVVTGLVAVSKKSSFDSNAGCVNDACPSSLQAEVDSYNRMRLFSVIGLVAGGVFAGTGGVLLLTLPKSEERISLRATPASVTIVGSF